MSATVDNWDAVSDSVVDCKNETLTSCLYFVLNQFNIWFLCWGESASWYETVNKCSFCMSFSAWVLWSFSHHLKAPLTVTKTPQRTFSNSVPLFSLLFRLCSAFTAHLLSLFPAAVGSGWTYCAQTVQHQTAATWSQKQHEKQWQFNQPPVLTENSQVKLCTETEHTDFYVLSYIVLDLSVIYYFSFQHFLTSLKRVPHK